ncbi:phenolic glucoside malonyltransferase 2-like [Phragmites australis]|uniref:phenolic glucoside malonyltransferase 2-like n=1 Tax=Phragmites australis TaxID=29695 RepID=UPI002D7A112E|nr:phenolic glucoside malonyltransferase 2-like [Phragmites australis]
MAVAPQYQQPAAGASSSPHLRVLHTALVPPSPSSGPAPPESSLPLTFFDIFWLHSPPVERLFFYRLAPDADVAAILSNLRDSLSQAVRTFYPLAGHLRLTPATTNRYELYYRPGDGVTFTVAEYDDDADNLSTDDPREFARVAPLVPRLPEGGAVLALQATLLAASRGLALGVTVHHAACDGAGSTHFLHTLAAACTGAQAPPPPPVIDRTLIPDPRGLYDVFFQAVPSTDEMQFVKMSADQLIATFTLSKDGVQRVKDAVVAEAARRGIAPPRCSSLVATLGFVWSCYQRAKASSGSGEGSACLLFPVDHRSRMKPPLPDKYLGNCVGPALGIASRGELAEAGAGGLLTACTAVAKGIDEAVSGIGTPSMDALIDRIKEVAAMGTLSVAGSPRFRVYDLDLGFGRPVKVDIVSIARTGAVAMAESRSSAGGMEMGISLKPDGMDSFRKCFADAIAWLDACTF